MPASVAVRPKPFPVPVTLSRPEKINNILMVPNSATQLPTNGGIIPSDRYISAHRFDVQFQVNISGANNPSSVLADAPWSLIENITVKGTHRPTRQQVTLWDIRGADLRAWFKI